MVTANPTVSAIEALLGEIAETLQLPTTLDAEVRQHYRALADYLANSKLGRWSPSLYAQGSFRIGTTVKPKGSDEFDLDFVCELAPSAKQEPGTLYGLVAGVIEESDRYGQRSERKPRCVRITFANNCHVDIVPAVPDAAMGGTAILIPDPVDGGWTWRSTNPKGYFEWFVKHQRVAQLTKAATIEPLLPPQTAGSKSGLQIGVQLLKRNHQVVVTDPHLRTPSIVHTTIAGHAVGSARTLTETFDAIVAATQSYGEKPEHVLHPANPREVISEKWDKPPVLRAYQAYAQTLSKQWTAVKAAEGRGYDVVMPLLNEMFGERPVATALKSLTEKTKSLGDSGRLKTVAAGSLTAVSTGLGNPRSTFFGDDVQD